MRVAFPPWVRLLVLVGMSIALLVAGRVLASPAPEPVLNQQVPTINFATLFGAEGSECTTSDNCSVALDSAGRTYIWLTTNSATLPLVNPIRGRCGTPINTANTCTDIDTYLAVFEPNGTLSFATYLGTNGDDGFSEGFAAIAVAPDGRIAVAGGGGTLSVQPDGGAESFPLIGANAQDCLRSAIFPDACAGSPGTLLVISPQRTVSLSTLIAGGGFERVQAVAFGPNGDLFVAGTAEAPVAFPTTAGALQTTPSGSNDGFVQRIGADGTVRYSTLFGGASDDIIYDLAVDSAGNAYIAGSTSSNDLPLGANAIVGGDPNPDNNLFSGFAAKLNQNGTGVVFGTYLVPPGENNFTSLTRGQAYAVGLDSQNNLYVGGVGLLDSSSGYVAKINANGSGFAYQRSLQVLSPDLEAVIDLEVSPSGLVLGLTSQSEADGDFDGYLFGIAPNGDLTPREGFGGSANELVTGIAATFSANTFQAALIGGTASGDFPVTDNALQKTLNGINDMFVLRINGLADLTQVSNTPTPSPTTQQPTPSPTAPAQAPAPTPRGLGVGFTTYFGGSEIECESVTLIDAPACALATDAQGFVYFAGSTRSRDLFQLNPIQGYCGRATAADVSDCFDRDFFLSVFSSTGTLVSSTFLGTDSDDGQITDMTVDSQGNLIIVGTGRFNLRSNDYPAGFARVGSAAGSCVADPSDPNACTSLDAFVIKLNRNRERVLARLISGPADDLPIRVRTDSANNIYLAGVTESGADFPSTAGALRTNGGDRDGFVTKLNGSTGALIYSTLLGGPEAEQINALAIDGQGRAVFGGEASSGENIPLVNPVEDCAVLQTCFSPGFVGRLNTSGSALDFATHVGPGNGLDIGLTNGGGVFSLLIEPNGTIIFGGRGRTGGPNDGYIMGLAADGSRFLFTRALSFGETLIREVRDLVRNNAGTIVALSNFDGPGETSTQTDNMVTVLDASRSIVARQTLGGRTGNELFQRMALNGDDQFLFVGQTTSTDLATSATAFQTSLADPETAIAGDGYISQYRNLNSLELGRYQYVPLFGVDFDATNR